MNKLGIAGTAGGLLTLIVEIVSLATTNWIELGQIHLGLFQACASGGPCVSINSVVSDYFKATQAFMIIGCLFLAAAVGFSLLLALDKNLELTPKIILVMFSVADVSIFIAVIIFIRYTIANFSNFSFGFSLILGVVSFVLSLFLSIGFGRAVRSNNSSFEAL